MDSETQQEPPTNSPESEGSTPDIVLEHGSTRLSLDLDGWEWFWLLLFGSVLVLVWLLMKY